MKISKLSLAVLMASSSMVLMSAAPLEEAIKDIDISGFGRYRFQSTHNNISQSGTVFSPSIISYDSNQKTSDAFHRFTLDVNFKATLDDNFFSVIGLRYDTKDITGTGVNAKYAGIANINGGNVGVNGTWGGAGDSFSIRQYYVGFTGISDTLLLLGRQPLNSYFTDDMAATGLTIINTSIEGLTLSAFAHTNMEEDEDFINEQILEDILGLLKGQLSFDKGPGVFNKIYGAQAVFNNDWLSAQAAYLRVNRASNLFAFDIGTNYAINDDVRLKARANVAYSKLSNLYKNVLVSNYNGEKLFDNSPFYGFSAGLWAYGFDIDFGYLRYGKKDKAGIQTIEDKGKLIHAGELLVDYTLFLGQNSTWFAKASYNYDNFTFGIDYVKNKSKSNQAPNIKAHEWVLRAGYKYNEKLNFNAYFSMMKNKLDLQAAMLQTAANGKLEAKTNRLRFNAVYTF